MVIYPSLLVGVSGSDSGVPIFLICCPPAASMADAAPRRGERRAAVRAQNEEEGRRTRQRLDDVEVRLDGLDSRLQQHDLRLNYLKAHVKVVL